MLFSLSPFFFFMSWHTQHRHLKWFWPNLASQRNYTFGLKLQWIDFITTVKTQAWHSPWRNQDGWQLFGFDALLLGCLAAELISEENALSLSLLQCSPLFFCQHLNVNHFLNSFQVIKTLPDRVCSTSKFSFNCLASVSRMGCGHPRRPEAFLIWDHMVQRMRLLPCASTAASGTSRSNCSS